MSNIKYDNDIVSDAISDLNGISGRFPSVVSRVQSLTGSMMSCRGFGLIGSGISSTSFSSGINECNANLNNLITSIRQAQVSILAYSEDDKAIQVFLDSLSKSEYSNLDLSSLENYIGVGRKLTNGFTSLAATIFTAGAGVVEGIAEFVETGADLVVLGRTAAKSIFTGIYDLFTGSNTTREMWEDTKAYVSEKQVESAFNKFYNETEFGKSVKDNAYYFDTVRGISSGLGYTAGLIGLNVVTGGLASGLGVGAAGSVGVGQLAATAGAMGFSSGTENAWADGASLEKGLLYGAANGAWEGAQWAIGAKINQYGGIGDKIASGIFKGGRSGAVTRVVLDAADTGVEGFVQPALSMIYKDYEGSTLGEKYKNAFNEAGGWANVRNQAIMGGIMSAGSEFLDARKILKSNSNGTGEGADNATVRAAGGDGSSEYRVELASLDILQRELMEDEMAAVGNYSRNTRSNIDGGYIRTADTVFNTSTYVGNTPDVSVKFMDGSYVPKGAGDSSLRMIEKYYTGDSFTALLDSQKDTLSGAAYTRYKEAAEVFASNGKTFNLNELKLIVNHSEGNVNRIKSAIAMSEASLMPQDLDRISKQLANKLFTSSTNIGTNIERRVINTFIDELQTSNRDTWKSGAVIMDDMFTYDSAMRKLKTTSVDTKYRKLISLDSEGLLSNNLVKEIVSSDGYPETIMRMLKNEGNFSTNQAKEIAEVISAKIFLPENAARIKAQYEIVKGNYNTAANLVASSGGSGFDTTASLFRASETFSQKAKRFVYYNAVEDAINMGATKSDALRQVKLMYGYAMDQVGTNSAKASAANLFKSNASLFGYDETFLKSFEANSNLYSGVSDYIRQKYVTPDGRSIYRNQMVSDFETLLDGKNFGMDRPFYINPNDVDASKSVAAVQLFKNSYVDAAKTNNPLEALKVMSKLMELEGNGTRLYVYNNGGKTCSHRALQAINLANQTIDGRSASTVFHETGHYLFGNVLKEQVPTGFDTVRLNAESTLHSSLNTQTLKTLKTNTMEIRYFSEYKGNKALKTSIAKQGFSSIDSYKKHLVDTYYQMTTSERTNALYNSTTTTGSMYTQTFKDSFLPKFNFDDALDCANLEISSMRAKTIDAVARSTGSYSTIAGMVDSLTKSKDYYWYGHTREYFDGNSNPNLKVYHELIADYTSLRVSGNTSSIGLLRQLFGSDLVNMLERTYQNMLK